MKTVKEIEKIKNELWALYRMADELDIGLVATNDVHYLNKEDSEAQGILMCIQTGTCIKDGKPIGFENDEFYYKTTEEMESLFAHRPDAIENTKIIAEKCNFDFSFGHTYLPSYKCPKGVSPEDYLREITSEYISMDYILHKR